MKEASALNIAVMSHGWSVSRNPRYSSPLHSIRKFSLKNLQQNDVKCVICRYPRSFSVLWKKLSTVCHLRHLLFPSTTLHVNSFSLILFSSTVRWFRHLRIINLCICIVHISSCFDACRWIYAHYYSAPHLLNFTFIVAEDAENDYTFQPPRKLL